jgi:peptidase C39-like protein
MRRTIRLRNAALLGIAGLGTAGAIALGPAAGAQAADVPINPAADTTTASTTQTITPPAGKQLDVNGALQPNGYYCGPAASRIALSAHGTPPTFDALAQDMGTTTAGTQSIDDITRVLNQHDNGYESVKLDQAVTPEQTETLRHDVVDAINDGDPVVANIVGQVHDTSGDLHRYAGGHYLTITGYDDDGRTVTITDPADRKGDNTYQLSIDDMAGWMATRGYSH